jgi:hypothetical protein
MRIIYVIISVLFFSLTYSQVRLNSVEKQVLERELSVRNKNSDVLRKMIGDSLLVHINIMPYQKSLTELKSTISASKELTKEEIDEIFGSEPDKNYNLPNHPKEWILKDFSGMLVTFYKGDNEIAKRKILEMYNVLSISVPVVRKDKKYALIQTSNEHEGGVLHIYKNTSKGWTLYKNIQLYYI